MANHRYELDRCLIVIPVTLHGKQRQFKSEFILDTGASYNIIDHSIADVLGYSVREALGVSTISSTVGKERGYRLVIEGLEVLGKYFSQVEVACHDLKEQGVEGLVGMPFLGQFDWCLHPKQQIISINE